MDSKVGRLNNFIKEVKVPIQVILLVLHICFVLFIIKLQIVGFTG